jgi:H2-forming N5,N10-methylenetetrahydromethanopterin dehydrogenase-like enzyme
MIEILPTQEVIDAAIKGLRDKIESNEKEIYSINVVTAEDISNLIGKYGRNATLGDVSRKMYEENQKKEGNKEE